MDEPRYPKGDDPSGLSIRTAEEVREIRVEQGGLRELVVRIDERTKRMDKELTDLRREVVTRPEFTVVRLIAFGLVGLVMVAVVAALMSSVLPQ